MTSNLCHVVFSEFPQDSRVRKYVHAAVKSGWQAWVICCADATHEPISRDGPLTVYRIPIRKRRSTYVRRIWEYSFFSFAALLLVSWLSVVKRLSVIHVHTLPDFLVFSGFFAKVIGVKVILDFHELTPEFMRQHRPRLHERSVLVKLLKFQERLSLNFADEVIVFHDPAKEILDKRANRGTPITVVMNGVDPGEMPVIVKTNNNCFRIVYNGTINFNLNLEMVVYALNELKRNRRSLYDRTEFHLYGVGPDLDHILNRAKELDVANVTYHGLLEFRKMMEELSSASLCILPPKKDIYSELYYSIKLTEMIFLRIPVIATRLKTYLRYYPEDCITYFNSEDVADLLDKIVYVYEHPVEIAQRAERAFEQYQEYAWPVMEKRYLGVLDRICGGGKSPG